MSHSQDKCLLSCDLANIQHILISTEVLLIDLRLIRWAPSAVELAKGRATIKAIIKDRTFLTAGSVKGEDAVVFGRERVGSGFRPRILQRKN